MDILQATFYGIIQGLTEFLPISSSGHLALLPKFLKIKDPGVAFDLTMHVGTALAVILYFRKELKVLIGDTVWTVLGKKEKLTSRSLLPLYMIASTMTTLLLVVALKGFVESWGARAPKIIAFNLAFFGLLMFWADFKGSKGSMELMIEKDQWKKALLIGFFQGFAIFPGVSRSGATLTISRFLGLERDEASRYSFLLSLPIILGGFFLKLPELLGSQGQGISIAACLWGTLMAFIMGLLSIHFFLKLIQNLGLGVYAIYRILLAGLILWVL
ncbi:MAG: undecaprenyl-diphosphatase [Halobacteriovoraceae bacterium]|nr:undecaprenyl-diphosphatase [Halobacteriovoraceae bacterium]